MLRRSAVLRDAFLEITAARGSLPAVYDIRYELCLYGRPTNANAWRDIANRANVPIRKRRVPARQHG
jgi:hypothetical protein